MTTKFNKDMYARMKSKKDEPFSAIGAKSVRVTERWTLILIALLSTPTPVTVGTTLPTPSVEELTPQHKKPRTANKQKEKLDSRSPSVWDDAGVALAHAHNVFSIDDMKAFLGVFANEVIRRHLHKLVQVPVQVSTFRSSLSLSFSFFFLVKNIYIYMVESTWSHMTTLEVENSKLKKKLISAMNEANLAKEKVKILTDDLRTERQLTLEKDEQLATTKEKIKGIAAKAVEGFQQTEEYNTVQADTSRGSNF